MNAILKFSLPEEKTEFELAIRGSDYHSVLWDLDQYLKCPSQNISGNALKIYDEIRDKLRELMKEESLTFY